MATKSLKYIQKFCLKMDQLDFCFYDISVSTSSVSIFALTILFQCPLLLSLHPEPLRFTCLYITYTDTKEKTVTGST